MIINEGIINKLTIEKKLSLLVYKNMKDMLGEHNISEEKLENVINSVSNIVVYKDNSKTVNYNVISAFKNEVFKNISILKTDESSLKLFKTEDATEAFKLLKKDATLILSKDPKKLIKSLLAKVQKGKELKEDKLNGLLEEVDYNIAIKSDDVILESDIDVILDKTIGKLLPFIDKIENPNLMERDDNKPMFSNKTKKVALALVAIYYNVVMYYSFGFKYEGDTNFNIVVSAWVIINLICILFAFRLRKKKIVTKNVVKEEISTHDFEVIEPQKHEVVVSKAIFNQIDLKQLCDNFYLYLLENGLMLEHKKIREIFAAMSSNRLLILNNKSYLNKEFLTVLNSFFGNSTYYKELDDQCINEDHIYFDDSNASGFTRGICSAIDNTSNVNISSLLNVNLENCHLYLNSLVSFAKNPNEKGKITLDLKDYSISDYVVGRNLAIPKNTWFILFTQEGTKQVLDNKIANDLITLDINVIEVEKKQSNEKFSVLSAVNFLDAINTAREKNYLTNESWEKIDELERELNSKINFSIENKIVRKLEVYASVYKIMCENEKDALDSTIANILLPIIFVGKENVFNIVLDTLKDVFEDENIILTKELLSKYK